VRDRAALAVATACGVGYVPLAPGTFGSLVGLVLWALLPGSVPTQVVAIVALGVMGTWSASVAERHFARRDPSHVIVDEVLGMVMTLFLNPVRWPGALLGFLFFRVADVVKPFPADRLERLPAGLGVMADDAMAGVYANLVLRFCLWSSSHLWPGQ